MSARLTGLRVRGVRFSVPSGFLRFHFFPG